ncbi:putative inactive ATP-dependent zinc metalloprotease FTSHI 5 [Ranunculus cassubicifolius]
MDSLLSTTFISTTNSLSNSRQFNLSSHLHSSNSRQFTRKTITIRCSNNKPQSPLQITNSNSIQSSNSSRFVKSIRNSIVLTVFCVVISFFPIKGFQKPAIAISFTKLLSRNETKKKVESRYKEHEFTGYTKRLLETVSILLKSIEDVRVRKEDMIIVKKALKAVKLRKEELQDEIRSALYRELRVMKEEKMGLESQSEKVVETAVRLRKEQENVLKKGGDDEEVKGKIARIEEEMSVAEKEYDEVLERIGEIEENMYRRETLSFSIGIRELSFIERESELLVERFTSELNLQNSQSLPTGSASMYSKSDIQRELEVAQREYWEQMLLPRVLEVEDFGLPMNQNTKEFVLNIKQGFKDSRELQKNMEARIRQKMKRFGDEKRFLVKTPADEVVKGYPEAELKWLFGDKEVVVPKAIHLHLFQGWKKWREEAKTDLKKTLLQNVDQGKQYVAQRQERILVDRDRVVAKTWFNEEKKRWEMDPLAVPYAVTRNLVENVRIRHDWAAMYVALKGDDNEYYVDIQELDVLFEDFGGFDGLYLKMLDSGVPTAVQLMWIPFSELDIRQQFLLTTRLSHQCLVGIWKSVAVVYVREWVYGKSKNIIDDLMMMIVFPILDSFVPFPIRMRLGMAWPERADQNVGSTWYLQWQSEAEMSFKSRKQDGIQWYLWFLIRTVLFGYVVLNALLFLKKKIPRLLGYGPLRRNPNLRKLRRVRAYFNFRLRKTIRRKKEGVDPIASAFDQMKRIKSPPIRLKEFASVDSMREEINEVVAFLQNPGAFREMGARAPKGVLIVGERGTGKTSLALAIAAEARVPLVEVKAQQLEAGLWVGQSASNVRELFQTARDLAPVIIFVEDFDLFAGVRGKFIHTKKQDHEAFINQLLVELDGFEKQDGVVLMATTRNLKQIDQALQRPGRMDRVFSLQRPTQTEREKILQIAAKETMDSELIDHVDWKKTFSSIVPRWLRETKIVKGISKRLVSHLGLALTKEDLQNVVDLMEPYGQISNGIELLNPPLDWTRESKFPHAVWAAGRALIALLLPNFDVVDNVWLEPFSWEGIGCTKITKVKDEGSMNGNIESRSYLEKKLVFCFGSYISSQILLPFGEENFLSNSEIKKAQEIATRMVIQYGWGPDDSPAIYFSSNAVTALSMGNKHEFEMAAKVEKTYNLAYDKAKEMIERNSRALEKIVEELLEFEMLTAKDLHRILEETGGTVEKEPFCLSSYHYNHEDSSGVLSEGENVSGLALLSAPTNI